MYYLNPVQVMYTHIHVDVHTCALCKSDKQVGVTHTSCPLASRIVTHGSNVSLMASQHLVTAEQLDVSDEDTSVMPHPNQKTHIYLHCTRSYIKSNIKMSLLVIVRPAKQY